jgi:hypothetical protein
MTTDPPNLFASYYCTVRYFVKLKADTQNKVKKVFLIALTGYKSAA